MLYSMTSKKVYLVCGGTFHDFDFAQSQLLQLLSELPDLEVEVGSDYSDSDAITAADCLITYTSDVIPTSEQLETLQGFMRDGKRWFALHGTNARVDFDFDSGKVSTPRSAPEFMNLLGSQFIAHPPLMKFKVHKSESDHPLLTGLPEFEVEDELYLSEFHGEHEVLLYTHFNGAAQRGFEEWQWFDDDPRPLLYLHRHHAGQVLYFMLGHCRGVNDMQPYMEVCPEERCAWESPAYLEVLRRGIRWAVVTQEYQGVA